MLLNLNAFLSPLPTPSPDYPHPADEAVAVQLMGPSFSPQKWLQASTLADLVLQRLKTSAKWHSKARRLAMLLHHRG